MTSVLQSEDSAFKSLSWVKFLFIFTLKATPMNEKWNFYFDLDAIPFRQLGEELILKGYAEMAFLNTGRHVVKKR